MNDNAKRAVTGGALHKGDDKITTGYVNNFTMPQMNLSILPQIKFNKRTGLWEVWRNGRVVDTCFTRLYAYAIAYRNNPIYKMALARGDPVPWPDDDIPFNGEPCGTADELGLEGR